MLVPLQSSDPEHCFLRPQELLVSCGQGSCDFLQQKSVCLNVLWSICRVSGGVCLP